MTSPTEITVATAIRHPRLRYVLDVIGEDLGYQFRFHNDRSVFASDPPRYLVYYGGENKEHQLPHHPILAGKHPTADSPHPASAQCPDLLARIFYVISRYEEYGDFTPDAHGRFPVQASFNVSEGYPGLPVVRQWTAELGRLLLRWFPDLPPPTVRALDFQPTYDIDILWAYHHRGWRGMASGLRDALTGQFERARDRIVSAPQTDPFFTIPALEELHRRHSLTATYFWLLSDGSSRQDPNPYPIPEDQLKLMRSLVGHSRIGIHPSYASSVNESVLIAEKQQLESILAQAVTHSRQHFLRFRLPDTYRSLVQAGITDDHSMGYADRAGWRAGTNLPFLWYDLERERTTNLRVHPFAAMDVTLKNYEGLSAADAGAKILGMAEGVRQYGGPFALLWHNSSFAEAYGWKGWWDMYTDLVAQLANPGQTDRRPPDTDLH